MCQVCNGTHVVHENLGYAYRTSCCPVCGPVSDEVWWRELEEILAKGNAHAGRNDQTAV